MTELTDEDNVRRRGRTYIALHDIDNVMPMSTCHLSTASIAQDNKF